MIRTIVNLGLLTVLLVLLALPALSAELIVAQPTEKGTVAGVRSVAPQNFSVIPNVKDFNGYVSFAPQALNAGSYQDNLSITAFRRQKASYYGVYTIYNVSSDETFKVEVVTPGIESIADDFDRIIVSLTDQTEPATLSEAVRRGSTLIKVDKPLQATVGDMIVVGDELTKVVVISTDGVVVTPLLKEHAAGQPIYPESIVATSERLINPQTQTITLAPGEKIGVAVTVWGGADVTQPDVQISIPLEFRLVAEK